MKPGNRLTFDLLDLDAPEAAGDLLWRACAPTAAAARDGAVVFTLPFQAQRGGPDVEPDPAVPRKTYELVIRAYGDAVVRASVAFDGDLPGDESPMLEWHETLRPEPLTVRQTGPAWEVTDSSGTVRLRWLVGDEPVKGDSHWLPPPPDPCRATFFPDGNIPVPLMPIDSFVPKFQDSIPLGLVERDGRAHRAAFAFHAEPGECFAGTGERFAKLDLAGRTLELENTDALGVNNRRCYKNVPFYVSSRPYGLFIHTPAHVRLSLADISTRAAQGAVEDRALDLFIIGGGSIERVLHNYRRVTGFPRNVPLWSFGTWMSRMTYFSEAETREVARRLREGGFPCDVIHLDTGWFDENWQCDWEFSADRFPDPERYMREMREDGFRTSLWQTPNLRPTNKLFEEAREKGYVAVATTATDGSNLGGEDYLAPIDFTSPEAVRWYQAKLARLLEMGASVIKADFGEDIDLAAEYAGMPARLLHNLYALLYQQAVFEITEATTGEGIIWARSAWAGSQRYPVHWGGDAACSWDGLAATVRGGLHLGLSGFAFWSHDVPGFHGVPDFMNTWPSDELYVRWTQVGVFTSHFRYHGAQPREPYEYPAVADLARKWWRLRYTLIPYLVDQAQRATRTGLPIFRALVFHHEDDRTCWHVDDQFYCGDAFLVAPVMNPEGTRDVYLPAGRWIDFWTGECVSGPKWMNGVTSPLRRMPVYVTEGAVVPVYPETVQCTDDMDMSKAVELVFDETYGGVDGSILGPATGL